MLPFQPVGPGDVTRVVTIIFVWQSNRCTYDHRTCVSENSFWKSVSSFHCEFTRWIQVIRLTQQTLLFTDPSCWPCQSFDAQFYIERYVISMFSIPCGNSVFARLACACSFCWLLFKVCVQCALTLFFSESRLSSNLWSSCLSFLSAAITSVYHHDWTQLYIHVFVTYFPYELVFKLYFQRGSYTT